MDTSPAGGERNLSLEAVDVGKGNEIARVTSGAALSGPSALASLAGQGVGESISAGGAGTAAAGTGVSAYSAGSSTLSSLGDMQLKAQQIQAEQKGSALGAFGDIAGSLTNMATSDYTWAAMF